MWIESIQPFSKTPKSISNVFKDLHIYKLGCEMRDTCDETQRKQYKQLMTLFITLCLELHDRYYFNVLRMITIFYHLYVDHTLYDLKQKVSSE